MAVDSNATVKVNNVTVPRGSVSGAINLNVGANAVSTVVTAPDATTTKTYTITVTRAPEGAGFADWASTNIPVGQDATFAGDGNADGVLNGVAYVFGNTPLNSTGKGKVPVPPSVPADVDVYLDRSTALAASGWFAVASWVNGIAPVFAGGVSIVGGEVRDTFVPPGGKAFYRYRVVKR